MSQALRHRAALRLAHDAPPRRAHRPIPRRIAIVLYACLIVPVIVLACELVRDLCRGWFA